LSSGSSSTLSVSSSVPAISPELQELLTQALQTPEGRQALAESLANVEQQAPSAPASRLSGFRSALQSTQSVLRRGGLGGLALTGVLAVYLIGSLPASVIVAALVKLGYLGVPSYCAYRLGGFGRKDDHDKDGPGKGKVTSKKRKR